MAHRDKEVGPATDTNWRLLYEETLQRAEAAEARAEELKRAEVAARSEAASYKGLFRAARRKRLEAVEETGRVRRVAKGALFLQSEVARLTRLLEAAGVDPSRRSTIVSLRIEVERLRKEVPGAAAQARKIRQLNKALYKEQLDNGSLRRLLYDAVQAYDRTRFLRDQQHRLASLTGECRQLRRELTTSRKLNDRLKERLVRWIDKARLLSPVARDSELRKALRRSRYQKSSLNALRKENARLRRRAKASQGRVGTLEAELAKLRSNAAVLSKTLYGRRSEKLETPGTGRRRGQQPGAPVHGRTPRPGLEERVEVLDPPAEARSCASCGKRYVGNGADESSLLEIEVRAHRRVIRRGRWRRSCDCACSPVEVSAPPVPRLFPNTAFGVSVWSRVLYEHFACRRPLHRVSAWLGDQRLPVAPGTLADSAPRFVPLFKPLAEAIRTHQNEAALRQADETGWRVQELRGEGRSGRAWLWASVTEDSACFHIDPSRSAEAALRLFGELVAGTVVVCDRYSAYKKLERLLGGLIVLAWCWAHQRRDVIECAAGQPHLAAWCRAWLERIAAIFRLNKVRLSHYDPALASQSAEFDKAQAALVAALDSLFERAARQLAGLPDDAREGRALRSLLNHREGLSVFVDRPRVPMDNNLTERLLRGPVIGRRLSFGSDSVTGADLAALMYSTVATLTLNGIDVLRWLEAWLGACAHNGGRPPEDLAPWLPWSMEPARRLELAAPT